VEAKLAAPAGGNIVNIGTGWEPGGAGWQTYYPTTAVAMKSDKIKMGGSPDALEELRKELGESPWGDSPAEQKKKVDFEAGVEAKLAAPPGGYEVNLGTGWDWPDGAGWETYYPRTPVSTLSTTFSPPSPPAKSEPNGDEPNKKESRCIDVKDKKHCKLEDGCFWNDAKKSCAPSGLKPRHREVLRR